MKSLIGTTMKILIGIPIKALMKTLMKAGDITGTLQYRLTNIEPDPDFPHYCEFFLGTCAPAGYIWVFPKDECTANVGIGVSLDRLHGKTDIKMYLDAWCKKDPRMKHAQFLDMVTGGVSTCPPIKETVRDGIAMVADAARHIDPITGGGIGNGCLAGMILGKVLGDIKERGGTYSKQDLQPYEVGWRAELEETLYRNWMAKNKLVTLTDEDFDKIIETLSTAGIGKLYRRQDEVGTPLCITVDHQSLEDNQVTIRDRDTMLQDRVAIAEIGTIITAKLSR